MDRLPVSPQVEGHLGPVNLQRSLPEALASRAPGLVKRGRMRRVLPVVRELIRPTPYTTPSQVRWRRSTERGLRRLGPQPRLRMLADHDIATAAGKARQRCPGDLPAL